MRAKDKRGGVIFSGPGGAHAVRSCTVRGDPVRAVHVIASFDGFAECLCNGHGWTPLAGEENGATVSHIE